MLVNNVNGEKVAASMVKDSKFYIEVAKFVQAYTTIVNNPNEFLSEVHLELIDEKKEFLNWVQFVTIMQNCDFGFKTVPTETELLVLYNYALEIGSLDSTEKRLATIDDVANAQKHYYNFVDEATDRAENEYLKYHKLTLSREREATNADNKLSALKTSKIVSFILMMFAVVVFSFGVVGMLYENVVVDAIGGLIPVWERKYIGGIILIVLGLILFAIFDHFYIRAKEKYFHLKKATEMIFKRSDETLFEDISLKAKFDKLKKDLRIVQEELADKNKSYDVKHNIEILKATNKYYQKLCELEDEYAETKLAAKSTADEKALSDEEFAPVKLTKEQEENLRTVNREAINLEGQFDEEAFNEKFENVKQSEEEKQEKKETIEEKEKVEKEKDEKDLLNSIDYIKDILGFKQDEQDQKDIDQLQK